VVSRMFYRKEELPGFLQTLSTKRNNPTPLSPYSDFFPAAGDEPSLGCAEPPLCH
jgi:hypothetical protein